MARVETAREGGPGSRTNPEINSELENMMKKPIDTHYICEHDDHFLVWARFGEPDHHPRENDEGWLGVPLDGQSFTFAQINFAEVNPHANIIVYA